MEPSRPGRMGDPTHMSFGSLPRNTRLLDHTTSTSASESAQASRLPPSRSRLAKPYGPAQKRGLPQYRCCSAERPPPVQGVHGTRTPTNGNMRTELSKRPAPSRLSTPTAANLQNDIVQKAGLMGAANSPTSRLPADAHLLHGRDVTRVRSQSRSRPLSNYGTKVNLDGAVMKNLHGSRNHIEDFVYNDERHAVKCSCCREASAELSDIMWTLSTMKVQIAKLEERVMACLRCENLISPTAQQAYRHSHQDLGFHARHSSMHPAVGGTESTRRRQVRAPRLMTRNEDMPPDPVCDYHGSIGGQLDYYDMEDNYWVQPEGDYDVDQVEWEEEPDFMGGQAFSQPAESLSTKQLHGQENVLKLNGSGRCTSAGVSADCKRIIPGDKRVWHLQQARNLLQTLPTSDELTSGVFSDSKRTAKSSGGKPGEDANEGSKGSGRMSGPRSAVGSQNEGTSIMSKQPGQPSTNHLLVKRASGYVERLNTSDCVEVRRHNLSKHNAIMVEVQHGESDAKRDQEEPRLGKNALTSNRSEQAQSSTPKSDTSASCFSGYFPVNPIPSSMAKPNCVPALGLGAKALPTSAWLSGEPTQGETYGT